MCLCLRKTYLTREFYSSRRQKWDAMTAEEKQTYLETTTDKGNKR